MSMIASLGEGEGNLLSIGQEGSEGCSNYIRDTEATVS